MPQLIVVLNDGETWEELPIEYGVYGIELLVITDKALTSLNNGAEVQTLTSKDILLAVSIGRKTPYAPVPAYKMRYET